MILVRQLSKTYRLGQVDISALRGVDLAVEAGEFVALAGPSGSGKSTLLNIVGGIERPTSGQVAIDGMNLDRLTSDELADLRAERLGYVFQTFNLLPVLSVSENVDYPLRLRKIPAAERAQRVSAILDEVGLKAWADHRPAQLSGGQRQRVAVARGLVGKPSIILADEPTANLDHQTGLEILDLMKRLNKKMGVTLLFATHDAAIMRMADRVVHLEDGHVVERPA